MTDVNKTDFTDNLWQIEDIRATNVAIQWRTPLVMLRPIILLLLDAAMLFISWQIADLLGTSGSIHISESIWPIIVISIGTLTASGFYGTDDRLHRFAKLFKSLTLAHLTIVVGAFLYQPGFWWVTRSVFAIAWMLNFILIGLARFLLDLLIIQIRSRYPIFQNSVALLGERNDIEKVQKLVNRSKQFRVERKLDLADWNLQSQLDGMFALIRASKVSEVFICSQQPLDNQIILFWKLKSVGIHLRMVPTQLQLSQRAAETKTIGEITTSRFKSISILETSFRLKQIFDRVAASIGLIILSPVFLAIAMAIRKNSPGPIFYKQKRIGLKGRPFKVWKFRTMVVNASELQAELEAQNEVKGGVLFKMKADPRITKVGKFLRKYSLDELPQLINVLQGEMSLVGPRPLAVRDYELSLQDIEQSSSDKLLRYEVLPGITGLWQVKGRTSSDSNEIFYWDMVYILQWSLALDLKILLETIKVVLCKEGSY
ncbi:sugar transferase [Chamaesiphon minutus]|uniref:Exopolysaccharide biosynthesis polyprenyl glycosylphosphotransferase n=1 Tax=Chamaesiphon minutus (strain ATCC 27169 / PCC 6605) TaxID=1173020 RepID=K9UBZ4_CHAP6|nr:sugar transferase [Chamaesiphon minutus]AFY92637.1 exopolysaccharide biosynthesis polyprenyl glycosylphosphotransferase [Chamaesiphon minutus PCC 6605]